MALLSLQGTTCTAVNGARSKLALSVLCSMSGVLFLEFHFSVLLSDILSSVWTILLEFRICLGF